jgi:hypothetical protein
MIFASPLRCFSVGAVVRLISKLLLLSMLVCSPEAARISFAADPDRDQLIELKSSDGVLFFRLKLDYIGKQQDPAHFRKLDGDVSNADFYVRTYENLGSSSIEFIQTVTRRASGENMTTQTPSGPVYGKQVIIDHAQRPRFGRDGNKIAEGKVIRQHNVFVSLGRKPDSLLQKTTIRYQDVEYSFDDILVYKP